MLALQANPTVLECLWSPLVEVATPTGRRLLELRGAFLSRRAHETFARYADVRVTGERERLLAVRRGEVPWAEVDAGRGRLAAEPAAAESVLPERPDREAVEEFLIGVRRENL